MSPLTKVAVDQGSSRLAEKKAPRKEGLFARIWRRLESAGVVPMASTPLDPLLLEPAADSCRGRISRLGSQTSTTSGEILKIYF